MYLFMGRKGSTLRLPQPPWSYAPSEVAEWLASTAGRHKRPSTRHRHRQFMVKEFFGRYPPSIEDKVALNLNRMNFRRLEGSGAGWRHMLADLTHTEKSLAFRRASKETEVEVQLRRGKSVGVRVTFKPPVSHEQGLKIVSRLGLRPSRGKWR